MGAGDPDQCLRVGGIYLVGIEHPALYRVQSIGNGNLRLSSHNKNYEDHVMSRAEFRNEVIAKVDSLS